METQSSVNATVQQHRMLVTESIDPNVTMHLYHRESEGGQRRRRLLQYMGLWGTWTVSAGEPSAVRILLATVCADNNNGNEPLTVRLGDLAWIVLQLQTVDGSPNVNPCLWNDVQSILADDLRMEKDGNGNSGSAIMGYNDNSRPAARRLVYDSKQQNQCVRNFADNEVLVAYKIRRVDDAKELANMPRPATTLERERMAYRVYNVIENQTVHAPLILFMEKPVPRNQMLCQRMQREKGFVKDGDLRGALGEGKTWIVLQGDEFVDNTPSTSSSSSSSSHHPFPSTLPICKRKK
jgi:hypothetical protein